MDRPLLPRILSGALPLTLVLAAGCGAPEADDPVGQREQATSLNSILGHRVRVGSILTGKCLDTSSGAATINAILRQYSICDNAMTFIVRQGRTTDTYQLRPEANSSLCLDVREGTANGGEPLQLFTCLNGANQSFFFQSQEIKPHHARTPAPGMCFDVPSGLPDEGLFIQQYRCHGGPNQRWRLFDVTANGFFVF